MDFSIGHLWGSMGLFARMVVIVLAIMSVLSLLVAGERVIFFSKIKRDSMKFAANAANLFSGGNLDQPIAQDGQPGDLGRTIQAGLAAYRSVDKTEQDLAFESVARALERQSQREAANMKKGLGLLATVSSTAPFVGLLGTVMGIVTAFQQMAASGSGGLGTVSGGIAEALITTAFGLLVAIPAVFAFNYLQGWADARSVDLAESCNEFLDLVARRLRKGATAAAA